MKSRKVGRRTKSGEGRASSASRPAPGSGGPASGTDGEKAHGHAPRPVHAPDKGPKK